MFKHIIKKGLLGVLFAALLSGFLGFMAPQAANADTQTVTIKATVVGSAVADATATATANATGSSYAWAAAQVLSKAKVIKSTCEWSTGTNSYWSGGHLIAYYDPVPSHVCQLKHPVTIAGHRWTHKKIGGGTSGANCGNYFIPGHQNVTYTHAAVLDVKSGTIAKVAVTSTVNVTVAVKVNVTLQYTYEGKTYTITKQSSASDHDSDTEKAYAHKKVTKKTKKSATVAAIAKVKASVKVKATARARAKAVAKAQAKAIASVDTTITINVNERPIVISAQAKACVAEGGKTGVIEVSGKNPNNQAAPGTVTVNGQTQSFASIAAGSTVSASFSGFAPGNYSGTFSLGAPINLSTDFTVTVLKCDTPPAPTMVLTIDKMNDIDQSVVPSSGPIEWSWTDLQAHVTAPTGAGNVTYTVDSGYGTTKFISTGAKSLTQASGTYDLDLRYTAPTEVPAGGYDTITITAVFGGKTYSASTQIKINPTPTIPK